MNLAQAQKLAGKRARRKPRPLVTFACDRGDRSTRVTVPVQVISEANSREHWRTKNKRKKWQQAMVVAALHYAHGVDRQAVKLVTLQRLGLRKLDDDNLANAFKGVRDAVAKWLGVDDGDERTAWKYEQHTKQPADGIAVILGEV